MHHCYRDGTKMRKPKRKILRKAEAFSAILLNFCMTKMRIFYRKTAFFFLIPQNKFAEGICVTCGRGLK